MDSLTTGIIGAVAVVLVLGVAAFILLKKINKKKGKKKIDPIKDIPADVLADFNKAEAIMKINRDLNPQEVLWDIARPHFIRGAETHSINEMKGGESEYGSRESNSSESRREEIERTKQAVVRRESGFNKSESEDSESELSEQFDGREIVPIPEAGEDADDDRRIKQSSTGSNKVISNPFSRFRPKTK